MDLTQLLKQEPVAHFCGVVLKLRQLEMQVPDIPGRYLRGTATSRVNFRS